MISKLKQAVGIEYTNKLQKMFQDMGTSKDLNDQFKNLGMLKDLKDHNTKDLDFNIQALTSGTWPFKQVYNFSLPLELEKCVTLFTSFYKSKHSGRKLNWLYDKSEGELVTSGFKNRYTLQASTLQMAVLLHFNSSTQWTIKSLSESTQIKPELLSQVLQLLVNKVKILMTGTGSDLNNESTEIVVNDAYKNKKLRMNINVPMKMEQKADQEQTIRHVEEDRKFTIQAKIVQVMKARKTLKHQQLMNEVLEQLSKFKPKVSVIKKNIGMLIDKDYLARVEGERDTYNYVA